MSGNQFKPLIFKNVKKVKEIIQNNPGTYSLDVFESQIKELFVIENPRMNSSDNKALFTSKAFENFLKTEKEDFKYIYYPWNKVVIKCIEKNDFFILKTNRNRELITSDEQEKLRNYKVAILGMSVGSNIAFALSQSGISNEMVIADFDELGTTNLNRITAGIHEIGLNKAIVAARKIYEDNPFASLTVMDKGVSEDELGKLLRKKRVDCLVEEIDDLTMKLKVRKLAIKYKVPVIMVTDNGDGVVVHVERYDKGYSKVFGKSFNFWEESFKKVREKSDLGKLIIEYILGGVDNVDPRVILSVNKIMARELVSWAQLGSAALLAGVVATVIIKNIVLGRMKEDYLWSNIQLLK